MYSGLHEGRFWPNLDIQIKRVFLFSMFTKFWRIQDILQTNFWFKKMSILHTFEYTLHAVVVNLIQCYWNNIHWDEKASVFLNWWTLSSDNCSFLQTNLESDINMMSDVNIHFISFRCIFIIIVLLTIILFLIDVNLTNE